MKRPSALVLLVIAGLAIQVWLEGWLWSLEISRPDISRPTDFSSFYTAGRMAASGQVRQLYDLQAQLQFQEALLGRPLQLNQLLPFIHPPLLVPVLQLVCTQAYMASYWRWTLAMALLMIAAGWLVYALLREAQFDRTTRILFLAAMFSFYPLFTAFLKGQDTALFLLGGILWMYGYFTHKDSLAGLGLALTIIAPQVALVLAVPFLFKRRRIWWWFCGGAAVLALYSLALVGWQGVRDYLRLLTASAGGGGYGSFQEAMFNFTGLMLRLFPSLGVDLVHWLAWGLFLAVILGLCILWRRLPEIRPRQLVLAVCLGLFAAPHLYYHDLAFLVVPLFGIAVAMQKTRWKQGWAAVGLPVAASLALLFADFWDPLRELVPYLLMLALVWAAWRVDRAAGTEMSRRPV